MYKYKNHNYCFSCFRNPIIANIRRNYEDILDEKMWEYTDYTMTEDEYRQEYPQAQYKLYLVYIDDNHHGYAIKFINEYTAKNFLHWMQINCPMLMGCDRVVTHLYTYEDMCYEDEYVII